MVMVGGARRWGWREPIRLGDDSPGLSIYSNRREGEGSVGGVQEDGVTAPPTGSVEGR